MMWFVGVGEVTRRDAAQTLFMIKSPLIHVGLSAMEIAKLVELTVTLEDTHIEAFACTVTTFFRHGCSLWVIQVRIRYNFIKNVAGIVIIEDLVEWRVIRVVLAK